MEVFDKEKKLLLDNDFDGIKELDNGLPPWLMWIFYATIFFAAIYLVHYHVFDQGALQAEEYHNEIEEYNQKAGTQKEVNIEGIKALDDKESIEAGAQLYVDVNCASCHGKNGEGNNVGPNLTDNYWINGNSPEEIFKIIKEGNLSKGMTPFGNQLNDEQIQLIMSYVINGLVGSNPENPKQPQGKLME